jgi:hypothetical protein
MTLARRPLPDEPEDESPMPTPLPDDQQTVPEPEKTVFLTPRRKQIYDAILALTDGGTRPWVGNFTMPEMNRDVVASHLAGIVQAGAIHMERAASGEGRAAVRRITVLVPPDRIRVRVGIFKGGKESGDRYPDAKPDDGRFSAAFRKAFKRVDYDGLIKRDPPPPVERVIVAPRMLWS